MPISEDCGDVDRMAKRTRFVAGFGKGVKASLAKYANRERADANDPQGQDRRTPRGFREDSAAGLPCRTGVGQGEKAKSP